MYKHVTVNKHQEDQTVKITPELKVPYPLLSTPTFAFKYITTKRLIL